MARDLVVVENLTKVFPHGEKDVEVLRGIDLTIQEGEMLTIVGKSGAGKSTLLHLLGTLDLPTSGRILYDGKDVTRYSSSRLAEFRNKTIGFVFQFHHLLPEFTALENVMMPGLIRGGARGPLEKEAKALLDEVGLSPRLTHRPGELSGGEQQRVALARALVMRPRLILADEPTGNLDTGTSDSIHELFFELNRSRGLTFLIVTHSRDLAARMPRVVTMQDGRVFADDRRVVGATEAAPEAAGAEPAPENAQESAPPSEPPAIETESSEEAGEPEKEASSAGA
jgi:lipoprotein-releasing system ATP-binding protein